MTNEWLINIALGGRDCLSMIRPGKLVVPGCSSAIPAPPSIALHAFASQNDSYGARTRGGNATEQAPAGAGNGSYVGRPVLGSFSSPWWKFGELTLRTLLENQSELMLALGSVSYPSFRVGG
jgi:hypothetical protein